MNIRYKLFVWRWEAFRPYVFNYKTRDQGYQTLQRLVRRAWRVMK